MANANVKIKVRAGAAWDQLYPETSLDQITDITTAGKNIAKLANPAAEGFLQVTSAGAASVVATASVRNAIGAAATTHPHVQSDITNLVSTLAAKADLVGGKVISSQIPDWMIGGLKYVGAITTDVTIGTTWRGTNGMTDSSETKGRYLIVTATTAVITLDTNHVFTVGDEGDTVSTITLEKGDWVVYRGKNGTNYEFDVINNTYQEAGTAAVGIVQLAEGAVTSRAGLSATSNASKVIDEYALRQVMKGIYYEASEGAVASALPGDLLFEIQA